MKSFTMIAFIALAWMVPLAHAVSDRPVHQSVAGADAALSSGEIRKVDKAAGKLTIKHGPLENLGMPAMTMTFRVKDAAMLEQVKPGDRVNFLAEKVDGALTVVQLRVLP